MTTCRIFLVLVPILWMILQGCQPSTIKIGKTRDCFDPSATKLDSKNVEDVAFSSIPTKISGMLENNKSKGYRFLGKKGQIVSYQIKPTNACVWLYASDNKILTETTLPKDDSYILQLANTEEVGTFQLSVSLDNTIQKQPKSNDPVSLGWLRIGSVSSTSKNVLIGDKLIKTTQEITIYPPKVPKIGDQVTIIVSVNLRSRAPESPAYKLAEKRGIINPGQKVTIMETNAFIDPTSSPYTVIWAKIGVER